MGMIKPGNTEGIRKSVTRSFAGDPNDKKSNTVSVGDLNESKAECTKLKNSIRKLTVSNEDLMIKNSDLFKKNTGLLKQINDECEAHEDAKDNIKAISGKLAEALAEIKEIRSQNETMTTENDTLKRLNMNIQMTTDNQKTEIDEAQHINEGLTSENE